MEPLDIAPWPALLITWQLWFGRWHADLGLVLAAVMSGVGRLGQVNLALRRRLLLFLLGRVPVALLVVGARRTHLHQQVIGDAVGGGDADVQERLFVGAGRRACVLGDRDLQYIATHENLLGR